MIDFDKELFEYASKMCLTLINRMSNYNLWEKVSRFYYTEIYEVRDFCNREAFLNPIVLLSILTDRLIELEQVVNFLEQNRLTCITGTQGYGKTDFGLKLYEAWKQKNNGVLVTNNKTVETDKIYVASDKELKTALENTPGKKYVLLDEGGKILSLYTKAFSKRTQTWLEYANDVRKYDAVFVFISPLFSIMFKGIRRFVKMIIQKLSLKTASIWLASELFPFLLTDIERTAILFDTHEIAVWNRE